MKACLDVESAVTQCLSPCGLTGRVTSASLVLYSHDMCGIDEDNKDAIDDVEQKEYAFWNSRVM